MTKGSSLLASHRLAVPGLKLNRFLILPARVSQVKARLDNSCGLREEWSGEKTKQPAPVRGPTNARSCLPFPQLDSLLATVPQSEPPMFNRATISSHRP